MAKKIQQLKPDTVLKNYWNDNEHFADLFNAVLFGGEPLITPDELEDIDTEAAFILEHRNYAESIRTSRDSIKVCKKSLTFGAELTMLGLESQEHIHYAMSMRVMGYDYGTYRKQYDSNAAKYQSAAGLTEDEYLSRMKKTDKFTPVITVVVYYGEKAWDASTTLHGMLDIPDKIKPFVNDYKVLLVEARKNNLILHNMNNLALFNMLKIILDESMPKNETKNKVIEYAQKHNVSKTVVMTIAGATNSSIDYNAFEKGDGNMCTLFDQIAKENEAKGEAIGAAKGEAKGIIETGFDFGLSENDILERLQDKLNISLHQAQEFFQMFGKQTV